MTSPREALAEAYSLALQLQRSGDLASATEACHLILQAAPAQAETLLLLGVCQWQAGEFVSALEVTNQALSVRPDWPDAHFNRGLILRALGRSRDAVASYQTALDLNPLWAEAHNNKANALLDLGDIPAAVAAFGDAIRCAPNFVEAHFNLGHTLQEEGRAAEALSAYEKAIALQPDHDRALNNIGLALLELDRAEEALASFERVLALRPDHAKAHNNRGNALLALGRLDDALASYERALSLDPCYAEAHYNRGNALQETMRFDEALACYMSATALRPDYADAHWNEGLCRLLLGDFAGGWRQYEWRWRLARNPARDAGGGSPPCWSGREPLAGRSIVLYAEQGMGDTLQFCRYVSQVAALGAEVVLEVQPALTALLTDLDGVVQVVPMGKAPPCDFSCSLLSLPGIFGTDLASIPAQVPYLHPDEQKLAEWARRLGPRSGMRVGLAWSGSPTHKRDAHRSIPLADMGELLGVEGVEFVALQPEVRESDTVSLAEAPIMDCRGHIRDFSDTAALVSLMDLVIAVDTSVAHLAGAQGRPVWILLPAVPDWRWLLDRTDSPWYPTARLFRRGREDGWAGVLESAAAELRLGTHRR